MNNVADILGYEELDSIFESSAIKTEYFDPKTQTHRERTSLDEVNYLNNITSALLYHADELTVQELYLMAIYSQIDGQNRRLQEIASAVLQVN